jgi:microcystin-dependent protein
VDGTNGSTTLTTTAVGGNQAISTRDPFLAVTWCVATIGVFPPSQ